MKLFVVIYSDSLFYIHSDKTESCDSFIFSFADKMITGTYYFVLVIVRLILIGLLLSMSVPLAEKHNTLSSKVFILLCN